MKESKNKILIGVDFGGTKILTGAMTEKGEVIGEPVKIPTNSQAKPEEILKDIRGAIDETMKRAGVDITGVKGIGMGVTGPLDIKNGVILECPQLPTMHFYPLKQKIAELYYVPVHMNNDANCLILAEALFGGGKGKTNLVGFTLGTGLGCAIVMNKKIFAGATDSAGEIWTSSYGDGIIEDFISGTGVAKIYKRISGKDSSSLEIAKLAEAKDPDALKTWDEFGVSVKGGS
ncbi:MAG TPA: ROK family protein, partial [Ignavibacteriales bacterium]|nr:ROK family protein [Ignavibacteriales bacterium]